jgi:16S rRNA processing protein RimM
VPLSSQPDRLKSVFVNNIPMEVERTWMHGNRLIFKFQGVDTISDAEKFAGAEVSIPLEQRAALAEDQVYQSDLIGCEVIDATGRSLGVVSDFQETGGTPLLEVKTPAGRELLIPFANSICTTIDLEHKRIEVHLPEGLLDLN